MVKSVQFDNSDAAASDDGDITLNSDDSSVGDREDSVVIEPEETYLFGTQLTKEKPEYVWDYLSSSCANDSQLSGDDDDATKHILKLSHVALGVGAKPNDRNILELEAVSVEGETISQVVASLTLGVQEMGALSLEFDCTMPVTLRLLAGSGPLHVTGTHTVSITYPRHGVNIATADDYAEIDEEDEELEEEEEDEDVMSPKVVKKRKVELVKKSEKESGKATEGRIESLGKKSQADENEPEEEEEEAEPEEEEEEEGGDENMEPEDTAADEMQEADEADVKVKRKGIKRKAGGGYKKLTIKPVKSDTVSAARVKERIQAKRVMKAKYKKMAKSQP